MKELIIKKSKFYSYIQKISSIQEIEPFLCKIKEDHKKATHICYAYKILENGVELVKLFDDGEPNGTAGKPILSVIEHKKLINVIVVVVRYFGGIKLGAGGLLRAYSKSAALLFE